MSNNYLLEAIKIGVLAAHHTFKKTDKQYENLITTTDNLLNINNTDLLVDKKYDIKAPDTVDQRLVCCICMTNYKNVIINPCNHAIVCNTCSLQLAKCPLCNNSITNKSRFFI